MPSISAGPARYSAPASWSDRAAMCTSRPAPSTDGARSGTSPAWCTSRSPGPSSISTTTARSSSPSTPKPSAPSTWPGAGLTTCPHPNGSSAEEAGGPEKNGRQAVTDPGRMRAMLAANADPSSLTCELVPVPDPGPGELLVEVRATAITAAELPGPEKWPAIPCHDLSGVVATGGPGVTGWQPGDEVYGLVGFDRPGAA